MKTKCKPKYYVLSSVDVRILASIVTGLPENAMLLTRKGILGFARALVHHRGSLLYDVVVYNILFTWLKTVEELGGGLEHRQDIALLRTVALRMAGGRATGNRHVYSTKYATVLQHLKLMCSPDLPTMTPGELLLLKAQVPGPHTACVAPELVWRSIVKSDGDLLRLDNVFRGAWDMQPSMISDAAEVDPEHSSAVAVAVAVAVAECCVCLESKSTRVFSMLSCEKHMLCATCVLHCRKFTSDNRRERESESGHDSERERERLGPSTQLTTRCPMRCKYRCTAIPLAAYEYQSKEMEALKTLHELLFEATAPTATALTPTLKLKLKPKPKPAWQYPAFKVGDYVRLRVAGAVKTWVRVDAVLSKDLLLVCLHTYPVFVLVCHDVILGVVTNSTPLNSVLSLEDVKDIEAHAEQSITFGKRKAGMVVDGGGVDAEVDSDADDVLHYHLYNVTNTLETHEVSAEKHTSSMAWIRVTDPVHRNEHGVRYIGHDQPVYDSLQSLCARWAATHDMLPTMLSSSCACVQDRGLHLSRQVCLRCRRVVCTVCFGGVTAVCAFCRACDTIGPHVVEMGALAALATLAAFPRDI